MLVIAIGITHWTKHKNRLNRNLGGKRFGDNNYAMEELVAELGAAFISSAPRKVLAAAFPQ